MVTVVAAGVLENNDRYRVRLDVKVMSVTVYFSFEVHCVVILAIAFFQMLKGYELISFHLHFSTVS